MVDLSVLHCSPSVGSLSEVQALHSVYFWFWM
ncbi:hypothetical protein Cadr_000006381 [Camelus dromedarius]|uniref:Uncharacterized protein n=1 Tax=Camelus dromedarius TaxID=9838 RepID=A0A5N4E2Y7_CAMDR|nr:hypothetical protein Cadr_000006381 [Camelus dromedarius]